jgi:hypothetical protein
VAVEREVIDEASAAAVSCTSVTILSILCSFSKVVYSVLAYQPPEGRISAHLDDINALRHGGNDGLRPV